MKKLLVIFLFLSSAVFATEWQSNIDHSEIHFKIPYMKVSEVSGRFRDFKATAVIEDGALIAAKVTIDTSSIDTGHRMRDNHLKGHDFFRSKEFPELSFSSSKVTRKDLTHYQVDGLLSLKDITKTVSFEVELSDNLKDTWGYENRFVKFSGQVDRKDFDMNWNKTLDQKEFLVGDKVNISGVFQIQPGKSLTPNSKHMIPDTQTIREKDLQRQGIEESSFARKLRKLINGK